MCAFRKIGKFPKSSRSYKSALCEFPRLATVQDARRVTVAFLSSSAIQEL